MASTHEAPVIALVCSTGGLAALTAVLGGLPAALPASVLVVQHQAPDVPANLLVDILATRTPLTVAVATDGAALQPGRVLVAPPGAHLLVDRHRHVALIGAGAVPPARPSADLLLTTLAVATGPACVAVVLSGHGRDGATGATAVHRFGGTVIAADEATSEAFGMPRETMERDGATDHVLPVHHIAELLTQLVTGVLL